MAKIKPPASPMDIGLHIVIPAFIISEFRTAFEMGCLLFIPFLLIDMVDGWGLLAKSLSLSFR